MKKSIHKVVRDLFLKDPLAVETFQKGLLNTNAYAKQLKPKVEKALGRKVKVNTITVAINRLKNKLEELLQQKTQEDNKLVIKSVNILTPTLALKIKTTQKAIIALSHLLSDPKQKDSILYFEKIDGEITVVYKPELQKSISRIDAPVIAEQKTVLLIIETSEAKQATELLEKIVKNYNPIFAKIANTNITTAVNVDSLNSLLQLIA